MLSKEDREKVLAAAQDLFNQKPLSEVDMKAIAEASGISQTEITEEFKNPREILRTIVSQAIEEATKLFIRIVDARGKADMKISRIVRELLRQYELCRPLGRLVSINFMTLDEQDIEIQRIMTKDQIDRYRQNTAIIGRVIAQGQSEGLFSKDIDPLEAAFLLRWMINGTIKYWQYLGKEEPLTEHAELVSRIFLKGVYK